MNRGPIAPRRIAPAIIARGNCRTLGRPDCQASRHRRCAPVSPDQRTGWAGHSVGGRWNVRSSPTISRARSARPTDGIRYLFFRRPVPRHAHFGLPAFQERPWTGGVLNQNSLATVRSTRELNWVQGLDLNQRPSGYEPDELPGCSTLQQAERQSFAGVGHCQRLSRLFPYFALARASREGSVARLCQSKVIIHKQPTASIDRKAAHWPTCVS